MRSKDFTVLLQYRYLKKKLIYSYDDGSYGPVLLRLAWHSSGTYNAADGSGGSNGGTMRFRAEAEHSANNGLQIARDLLEKHIKPKFPELSYGDMYTLGGVVAIQELVSFFNSLSLLFL